VTEGSAPAPATPIVSTDGVVEPRHTLTLFGVAVACALFVYGPILYYMGLHWQQVEDYSHGFLIAPLAVYFAWQRLPQLRRVPLEGSWLGVLPLLLGAMALAVGRLGGELMSMRASFVLTLIGIVIVVLGLKAFRILAFPLLFMFLMVPLPQSLVNVVAFPLQLTAADAAVNVLYLLQIPALREGNIIHLVGKDLFVAEACSGLRSLMALITLGVVFAYFFRKSMVERIILVLSAIPIAILVNAFRVALTGVLTHYFGSDMATGAVHATEGLFTFGIAFLLLLAEARLLSVIFERVGRQPSPRVTA
jgi:exosortase